MTRPREEQRATVEEWQKGDPELGWKTLVLRLLEEVLTRLDRIDERLERRTYEDRTRCDTLEPGSGLIWSEDEDGSDNNEPDPTEEAE